MTTPEPDATVADIVEVRTPADVLYVSTLRLTAASLAARCDLTVDDIEDLRLAVDEACALLLPHAVASSTLDARFEVGAGALLVHASVATNGSSEVDRDGFAWTVLGALASNVEVQSEDHRLTISVTKKREVAPK